MFAIISVNNNQYKVKENEQYSFSAFDYNPKEKAVVFDKVLLISSEKEIKIGDPYITGAKVQAEIIGKERNSKKTATKFKAKKRYKRIFGYRQEYIKVKIIRIK